MTREDRLRERHEAYKRVFSTEEGQRVLIDLMDVAQYSTGGIDEINPNPNAALVFLGKRSMVMHIMKCMNFEPGDYLAQYQEVVNRVRADRNRTGV